MPPVPPADRRRQPARADHDLGAPPPFLRAGARSGAPRRSGAASVPAAGGGDPRRPPALPLPALSRRRIIVVVGLLGLVWLGAAFARQVGDASAASLRADGLRQANADLRDDIATLQEELVRVRDGRFVGLRARAFGLGGRGEIPFSLAADAPPLAADAPGSAAVRLGSEADRRSPLEAWLEALFGPAS